MARIIKTDGTQIPVEPNNGTDFQLEELQKAVDGYIEIHHLPAGGVIVVNEEGRLRNLPVNEKATWLANQGTIGHLGIIVGDVLVCKESQIK